MLLKRISRILFNLFTLIPFLLLLSTVFVVNNYLVNGIVSGKYIWFYKVVGFVPVVALLSFIFYRKKVSLSVADLLGGLFLLTGLLSAYFVETIVLNKLILFILAGVLFFCFRVYFYQYKKAVFLLTIAFIIIGLVESLWGLAQLYNLTSSQHSMFRTTGSFFNPGPYAGYIAMALPVALYYCLNDWRVLNKKFDRRNVSFYVRGGISLLTFFTGILVLPVTMSRAAWLASFIGCVLVSIFYLVHKNKRRFNYWKEKYKKVAKFIIIPVIIVILIGGTGLYYLKKDSADGRFLMWKVSLETIAKHPLGVGVGNFSGSYGIMQAEYFSSGKGTPQEEFIAGNPDAAFNEYLQLCVEWGIIPFLLFLGYIILVLYKGIKNKRYAYVGGLVSLLVFASMSYPFNLLPFIIAFVFLCAACLADNQVIKKEGKPLMVIFALSVLLLIAGWCVYNRYPLRDAYLRWTNGRMLYNAGQYKNAIVEYEKVTTLLNHETQFLFEYAQSLSKTGEYLQSNQVLTDAIKISCDPMLYNIMGTNFQAMENYADAEQCFITASNIVPHRLYPYYLLVLIYAEKGDYKKACQTAEFLLQKEPKVHSLAVDEMKQEAKKIYDEYKYTIHE